MISVCLINAWFTLTKVVRYYLLFVCHKIIIIIQEIVLVLQGKRYHCKACMYESSAKVPKYSDCGLLIDPMYHRRHIFTIIFNIYIIRLSEAVPMRPFFRVKNGGRWRMNHTPEGDNCGVNA